MPGLPVAMTMGVATYYLAYDQVGSLRVVADSSGTVVKEIEYDSFGNIIADTNPAFTMPFGFAGGIHDRVTGLVRFGYWDYDPDIGRWTAKDPILFAGGDTDLYGYVQNDPVNFVDPFGLLRWPQAIYDDALKDAQQSGLPGSHNGPQDAYRHCLASCESSRENGETATQCMAWANENKGDWKRGQEQGERAMDDHNNATGIGFGKSANSFQDCKNMCMNAVNSGQTINNYQPGSTPNYSPGSAY